MCGIFGWVPSRRQRQDNGLVEVSRLAGKLCAALAHRGPDDRGWAAFADNDERAALEILEQERGWNRALGEVQQEVLADETLDRAAAAHTFLGLRLILRVRAHLANIASTVVLPLHRIDFARESYLREARERLNQEDDRA